jgi:hypothetical protein
MASLDMERYFISSCLLSCHVCLFNQPRVVNLRKFEDSSPPRVQGFLSRGSWNSKPPLPGQEFHLPRSVQTSHLRAMATDCFSVHIEVRTGSELSACCSHVPCAAMSKSGARPPALTTSFVAASDNSWWWWWWWWRFFRSSSSCQDGCIRQMTAGEQQRTSTGDLLQEGSSVSRSGGIHVEECGSVGSFVLDSFAAMRVAVRRQSAAALLLPAIQGQEHGMLTRSSPGDRCCVSFRPQEALGKPSGPDCGSRRCLRPPHLFRLKGSQVRLQLVRCAQASGCAGKRSAF